MQTTVFYIILVQMVSMCRGKITVEIDPSEVCEGASVTLTCTVNPKNDFIVWRRNGVRVSHCVPTSCGQSPGYNITIDYTTDTSISNIYINSTSLVRDGGKWTCSGEQSANLTITAPASSIIKDKKRLLFTNGMVTEVTCYTGTIDSDVSFTWYIYSTGSTIQGQNRGIINGLPASILQLTSTKQLNNKRLYCSATNQCDTGNTDNITLDIRYRPTVQIEPLTSPYKIIEGNQLTLTCNVDDSNPQPTSFTWSKDGGSITGQRSSVFSLTSVQRSQAGQYTCTANNEVGTGTSTSVQVDVLYPPTVSTPSIYKILESSDLSITCSGNRGNPTVTSYRWTGPGGYNSTGAILTIPDIKRSQTGVYRCTGSNIMIPTSTNIQQTGRGTNQTTIDVLYVPEVSLPTKPIYTAESETVSILCTVDSYPVSSNITWYDPDGRVVSYNKELVINNITRNQVGVYNCTAITVLQPTNGNQQPKTDSKTVLVKIPGVPDQPRDFKLVLVTHDSICVELQPCFNNGGVQEFVFQYSLDNIVWFLSGTVKERDGEGIEDCIDDLDTNTVYYIRVIAQNRLGQSQPLSLVTAKPIRTSQVPAVAGDDDNSPQIALGVCLAVAVIVSVVLLILVINMRRKLKSNKGDKTTAVRNGEGYTRETSTYDCLELNTRSESPPSTYNNLELNRATEPLPSTYANLDEQPTN